ncbi:hypothetical protein WJ0W_005675 [Paenibacillus melissococcoides]|uniref:Uncharacterized protein n=1 Tax=Paenibacillus melissococcoides TaxID=2912268 RepID=A0ABM9G9J0_9BACL|nr:MULTISPECIES: hypothetical protein [Paenibacillus]MEB9894048.1 hypothetical protein [Bacillus cereus]CAH8245678.1 hypothetical protein WJ0W_002913 [Paenibacillus melissococcoides]CAH8248412.1 hypothetical protein WJ0W_005675 [Paenibacillus melissococcoides]CAH8711659.1 hypothetical protein WDD9_002991 [Paenibacillus melissococcoides]CAH8712425.1 hypothetical protein HTL2_003292 [Paenibacillus melissococcoides]
MTQQLEARIEQAIEEYMPLYDRYLDEPDEAARAEMKAQMVAIGRKYGFDGGLAS